MNFDEVIDGLDSEDLSGASEDFFEPEGRKPILPGRYLSRLRSTEWGKTQKGKAKVKVKFEKFEDLRGNQVREFPPFEDLYFHKTKSWDGTGEISAAARYLRACGLKWQNWTQEELNELMKESEGIPVVVIVGWEQDYREVKEGAKALRTKFFRNQDGTYTHQKKAEDGSVVTARARVTGYERAK